MIARFYGLSAVTLTMSPIGLGSYKELTSVLDSSTNKIIISVLRRDLEELLKFLESLPTVYEDPSCNRVATKLRLGKYKSEQEKKQLEESLEGKPKILSTMIGSESGTLNKLSDGAYKIVQELLNNIDRIRFFHSNIYYGDDNSGVTVLGEKLYILRAQSRTVLNYRLSKIYKSKTRLTTAQYNSLNRDLDILESYICENDNQINFSEIASTTKEVEYQVCSMDVNYFNNKLGLNLTEDDYYKITKELSEVGLFGFTTYNKELYEDFLKSCSFSSSSDLKIYPNQALYGLCKDLREIVSSYEFTEGRVS